MKLSVDQIREITQGAVAVFENEGKICFRRFTAEQEALYYDYNKEFWKKTFSTAGIKLCFKTDSDRLTLDMHALESTSRVYFSVDVFADDQYVGSIDNFSEEDLVGDYTTVRLPLGHFEKSFQFGNGMKEVTIYFPWSVEVQLEALCVDDSAVVIPAKPEKKMLVFGDSITHGYDAIRPVNRYISKVAEALHAEEINKAIGGEIFFPELAERRDDFDPDYIFVAYGTNDWGTQTWESFSEKCPEFYKGLAEAYPNSRIFALAPIWRKDYEEVRQCCDFLQVREYMRQATQEFSNIEVIDCFDFVPKEEEYFADFKLHPNDKGFEHYSKNLIQKIRQMIG